MTTEEAAVMPDDDLHCPNCGYSVSFFTKIDLKHYTGKKAQCGRCSFISMWPDPRLQSRAVPTPAPVGPDVPGLAETLGDLKIEVEKQVKGRPYKDGRLCLATAMWTINYLNTTSRLYLSRRPAPSGAAQGVDAGLREAAQAVIDRWNTPNWKDVPATAEFISRLQKALAAQNHLHPAQGVDVEKLKRHEYEDRSYIDYGCPKSEEDGWNAALDKVKESVITQKSALDLDSLKREVHEKFCAIPYEKGRSVNLDPAEVIDYLAAQGHLHPAPDLSKVREALERIRQNGSLLPQRLQPTHQQAIVIVEQALALLDGRGVK